MNKAACWVAFRVKTLADGGRKSYCILKTEDGKDCAYFHFQKKGDSGTSTLKSHIKNNRNTNSGSTNPNNNSFDSANSTASLMDPDELDQRQSANAKPSNIPDIREEIKKELQFVKDRVDPNIKPMDFYAKNEEFLPNLSKAAKHFFLASSSSVESESFFSDATSLYGNKQRNRLSANIAQKLLQIRVMQKRNIVDVKKVNKESEESDSGEEF